MEQIYSRRAEKKRKQNGQKIKELNRNTGKKCRKQHKK